MQVSLLIYQSPKGFAERDDPDQRATFWAERIPYYNAIRASGALAAAVALQPPETAVTLRLRNGQRIVEDGPYADTKEQLGGVLVLDVPDLAGAVDWMWRFPGLNTAVVELRPNLTPISSATAGPQKIDLEKAG